MKTPKSKKRTRTRPTGQNPDRSTVTQSISFDWQIYELMEEERAAITKSGVHGPFEYPRSTYLRQVLTERFKAKGLLK